MLLKADPQGDHAQSCNHGVPLESHRRCAACGWLIGCDGEMVAGEDPRLCSDCWDAGKRLVIRGRRQRYWKPADVAAELGLSHVSILRAIREGRLKAIPVRKPSSATGVRYLVPDAALKAFLAGGSPDDGAAISVNSAQLRVN